MSVGPLGVSGSFAAAPLAQNKATEDRMAQQTAEEARSTQARQNAEQAAGIGEMDQDQGAYERDADGRRPWERPAPPRPEEEEPPAPDRSVRDPTGERGQQLDLTG